MKNPTVIEAIKLILTHFDLDFLSMQEYTAIVDDEWGICKGCWGDELFECGELTVCRLGYKRVRLESDDESKFEQYDNPPEVGDFYSSLDPPTDAEQALMYPKKEKSNENNI